MFNALFVNLNETYRPLDARWRSERTCPALRHCTVMAWRVDPEQAAKVRYLFGAVSRSAFGPPRVVSAYAVRAPAARWPRCTGGAHGGRYVIPVSPVDEDSWRTACSWPPPRFFGVVRYAVVTLVDARLATCAFPREPAVPEEVAGV